MEKPEDQNKRGSGGDGGKIFIFAKEIRGHGKILADGGDGSIGGRGGEVHIISEKNNYAGKVSAKGGKSDGVPEQTPKKIDWQKWGTMATFVFGVIGVWFYLQQKPSIQQKGNINTVRQTGNNIVNIGANIQIDENQRKVILDILSSEMYSITMQRTTSGNSRILADQLVDILREAGWNINYNPAGILIWDSKGVDILIADVKNIPKGAERVYDALNSVGFPFEIHYSLDQSQGRNFSIVVGDL